MARVLLVINASHDPPTEYLHSWCEKILEFARDKEDIVYLELSGHNATKEKFEKNIAEKEPQLIIFNSHGTEDAIQGYPSEVLIKCDQNEGILKERIVHAMSCEAGRKLGPQCVKFGTRAYIGYSQKFKLACEKRETKEKQLNDQYAGFVLEPAFEAVLALVQGNTAEEAFRRSQRKAAETLRLLLTKTSTPNLESAASQLYHNFTNQVCLGDLAAKF